jgi:hypothetical protein
MGGDEPYAYHGTGRSKAERWENRVTHGCLHALMTFDALGAAPLLLWLGAGQHIDLYDVEPYVSRAADETAGFLRSVLHDR